MLSISFIAALSAAEQEAVAGRAGALFSEHAASSDTVEAGYIVEIYTTSRLEL